MSPQPFYAFPGIDSASSTSVGGKGLSLLKLTQEGFPVPPGLILPREFFSPWIASLRASETWIQFSKADPSQWPTLCERLSSQCEELTFNSAQQEAFTAARDHLSSDGFGHLFAVRSSSPDEDLASASFAGGYATSLGVSFDTLELAIKASFASCLDYRVFAYKKQNGFDLSNPQIAVIIQAQIDSDVSGVGFSINPTTNDYDEAVFNANWGLGETVVAGLATPDHFVVDKERREILSRDLGAKQVSYRLSQDGGTEEQPDERRETFSLSDEQLKELTELICQVEKTFGQPIDIEWAVAQHRLHLLQARPITTYVPLSQEMQTPPGARRRLYADIALSSGLTINAPISTMGLDWMQEVMHAMFRPFIGSFELSLEARKSMWFFAGHRMYQDLSNVLWFLPPKFLGKSARESDALLAETLAHIDRDRYRARQRPSWFVWKSLATILRMVWASRGLVWKSLAAMISPKSALAKHKREVARFTQDIESVSDHSLPLEDFRSKIAALAGESVLGHTFPTLIAYLSAYSCIDKIVGTKSPERKILADQLKLGFKGNVVAEMGVALFKLSQKIPSDRFEDVARLEKDLENGNLPSSFLKGWDAFLKRSGWRGPLEMDIAQARYQDDPKLAFQQMAHMARTDQSINPAIAQDRLVEERWEAYRKLMESSSWIRRKLLRYAHSLLDTFGGTRDTPKHQNLLAYQAVRNRIAIQGRKLHQAGRLDSPEQVFDLSFRDLEAAEKDASYDLRKARESGLLFRRQLERQVHSFPSVIDSRGRILRPPPPPETPGEIHGAPISNGTVRGSIKTLRYPDEKPIEVGDILVAYTTDPGWTPLFVNAAAIVLEVGGVLQHGAVVAREYGKPCIAGIDQALTRLQDGQYVEVDGTTGVIRFVDST